MYFHVDNNFMCYNFQTSEGDILLVMDCKNQQLMFSHCTVSVTEEQVYIYILFSVHHCVFTVLRMSSKSQEQVIRNKGALSNCHGKQTVVFC